MARRSRFVGSRSKGLAVGLLVLGSACRDDGPGMGGGSSGSTTASGTTDDAGSSADETSTPVVLEEPYGACAGEDASTECVDAGPERARCIERSDPQGVPYSTCAVTCHVDADCPPVGAGNVSPSCSIADGAETGACVLDCNLEINSCAAGTICIDGDPPLCMWPAATPGHPDAQSFCDTACGPCGATLFLPWMGDCASDCVADLADCSEPELAEIFACTGGEACPVGGAVVGGCVELIACVMGS